jgi:hypothetical protein
MIKKILPLLFLLIIGIMFHLLVTVTIERSMYFLEEINRSDIYNPFLNNSLRHLAPEEINNLASRYKIELSQLNYLKSITIALISLCGILILAIITIKPDFSVKKFDGVTVLATYVLLLFATFAIFKVFTDGNFNDGHNATIGIRASVEIILLVIAPLTFFAAFTLNKYETSKNMHQVKWITHLALVLTILSGLIALIIGFAFLSTPDVSKFTS